MRSGSMVNSSVTATEDFWHILVDMTDGSYATGLEKLAQVQHSAFDNATQTQALTVGRSVLQFIWYLASPK